MKIYYIYDNRENRYISKPYTSEGVAKAYVAHLGLTKDCVIKPNKYFQTLKPHEVSSAFLEHAGPYDRIKYKDQTRFQVRMFDLEQLNYEVI